MPKDYEKRYENEDRSFKKSKKTKKTKKDKKSKKDKKNKKDKSHKKSSRVEDKIESLRKQRRSAWSSQTVDLSKIPKEELGKSNIYFNNKQNIVLNI